ncbi:MAG: bifunctional diaminohydroxyphosphoribosylaminopyrimidine deaminase/5-amino-6-(5-phosphoribosylamino)uracil reductase RibD, partial [Methylococcaceae bacterium]|nr:bifunctional diaminohydroxyphosphoribosylaminopyrimidine deaminase/5-amino-6-(5-phosphoribosylamino)uracil reductase RibD [Methylococcaceae bacterium]
MGPASDRDYRYMARALQLARNGLYTTHPNPRVGCVLVKGDQIIGEGWHVKAGDDHAEIVALKNAENAEGSTAYVTLEPCSHHGRTPPCADALIRSGVSKVVAAMQDPNPLVAGNGLTILREAGIETVCGVLEDDARRLNRGFIQRMTQGRPFVRSKLAMSLDGRTALASGESRWITSGAARQDVHRLRAQSSAILTGIDTVLADDPALTARIDEDVLQPLRIVLDTQLRMPASAQLAKLPGRSLILTCCDDQNKIASLRKARFEIHHLEAKNGRIDLNGLMTFLAGQQINELLVETGPTLNGALLAENLVDEWIVYMA